MADAADVLSDQLRAHLARLSKLLRPHVAALDRQFRSRLRRNKYDHRQIKALSDITPGAAARFFAARKAPSDFFETVAYSGRRLAKLNLAPSEIIQALRDYDKVLDPVLARLPSAESTNFQWVREQLHFCIVLMLNNAFYQVREAEAQAFYDLFRVETEARNLDELLEGFVETLKRICRADAGRLWLREDLPKTLSRPRFIDSGAKAGRLILDAGMRAKYKCFWSLPLVSRGRAAGVLQLGFSSDYRWLPRELDLLNAAAERCVVAAEKARLTDELARREEQVRMLAEHMVYIEEEERRRISRELHDEAGQSMLCVRLQLELIEKDLPASLAALRAKIHETREITERTITEIRRIIAALSPAVLEQLGLAAALRQLTSRFRRLYAGHIRLNMSRQLGSVSKEVETIVYRLVQECYHNIAKHSRASHVNIWLSSVDESLTLRVDDDGVGFEVDKALEKRNSFGLTGMNERVKLLGGKLDIRSRPHQGTTIHIELPVSRRFRTLNIKENNGQNSDNVDG